MLYMNKATHDALNGTLGYQIIIPHSTTWHIIIWYPRVPFSASYSWFDCMVVGLLWLKTFIKRTRYFVLPIFIHKKCNFIFNLILNFENTSFLKSGSMWLVYCTLHMVLIASVQHYIIFENKLCCISPCQ